MLLKQLWSVGSWLIHITLLSITPNFLCMGPEAHLIVWRVIVLSLTYLSIQFKYTMFHVFTYIQLYWSNSVQIQYIIPYTFCPDYLPFKHGLDCLKTPSVGNMHHFLYNVVQSSHRQTKYLMHFFFIYLTA